MNLRHLMVAAAACSAALIAAPGVAAAAEAQDFTLHNGSGKTITEVHISPTSASDWEEDVLGQDVLQDDASVLINFDRDEDTCEWDVKVTLEDGSEADERGVDLCSTTDVTVE